VEKSIKVLIIDDDKLARKGLISIVPWNSCGMEVVGEAANGQKALEFLEDNHVDLAMVDISMPVMNGLEFIKESKKRHPYLQYVVLSFYEDFQNVQAALRLGTLDYISKIRLDQQDCIHVFSRVRDLIQGSKREERKPSRKQNLSEKAVWNNLQNKWLAFQWLYTERIFEQLVQETKELDFSGRELERLFVRIYDKAIRVFNSEGILPVAEVLDVKNGIIWIKEFKRRLGEKLEQTPENSCTEACIYRAVIYTQTHLSEQISISTAAQVVSISRSYFATNFKKMTGMTFNAFLRGERVRKAEKLLSEGLCTLANIAQEVGYEDEKYFIHVFAEHTGMNPAEYLSRKKQVSDEYSKLN